MPCGGCGGYHRVERPDTSPPPVIAAIPAPVSSTSPPVVVAIPAPASSTPPPVAPAFQQVEILAVSSTPSRPIDTNETIADLVKKKREALLALRRSQNKQY